MARAIVQAHTARLGLPAAEAAGPPAADAARAGADPVQRAALQAAHALGFSAADASCVAEAWARQTQRTGVFSAADWPCEPADFGLGPWPRDGAFAPGPQALGLYAVLPDAAWVGRMARAGVPTLQLRFKSGDARAVQAEVRAAVAAVAAVQGRGARLVVNDHWQAAIEAGAWGVHLGQEDLDRVGAQALPALRAAGLRLGLSTHGYAEMRRAEALGPSYIALGAVFPTTLKAMPTPPQGLGRLAVYARLLRHRPLVAIGGIDAARLPAVLATGVGSAGVVRALVGAADPEAAAGELLRAFESAAGGQARTTSASNR
ncbi:MAG: thiamine phosphate synthase [Burkholderiales bacterium]|nr:thiamine phosphate synthase [Burkholderiales bacterium]